MCRLCQKNKKAMKSFDFTAFSGAMEGTRTPGLLIRREYSFGYDVVSLSIHARDPKGERKFAEI